MSSYNALRRDLEREAASSVTMTLVDDLDAVVDGLPLRPSICSMAVERAGLTRGSKRGSIGSVDLTAEGVLFTN